MSVNAVSSQQAWGEFLKVARNAQVRNPGLTGVAPTQRQAETAAVRGPLKTKFVQPASFQALQGLSSADAEPKRYTRILGNHFDAYA